MNRASRFGLGVRAPSSRRTPASPLSPLARRRRRLRARRSGGSPERQRASQTATGQTAVPFQETLLGPRHASLEVVGSFAGELAGHAWSFACEPLRALRELVLARRALLELLGRAGRRRLTQTGHRSLGPLHLGLELALSALRVLARVLSEREAIGRRAPRLLERVEGVATALQGVGDATSFELVGHRFRVLARRRRRSLRRNPLAPPPCQRTHRGPPGLTVLPRLLAHLL